MSNETMMTLAFTFSGLSFVLTGIAIWAAVMHEVTLRRNKRAWAKRNDELEGRLGRLEAQERHPAGRDLRSRGISTREASRPKPDPSDPYWRAQDAAFLRMTQGASFGGGVTLPSGRFMTGDEIKLWQQVES